MPTTRSLAAGLCAALVLSGCGRGDDGPPAGPGGVDAAPTTSGGRPGVDEDRHASPAGLSQRCESPAGFTIAYPEGWAVNPGETVPACTRFAPDPFRVPPGTDVRVGAVTARVQPVPFERIASSQVPPVASRTDTTVDGRPAARIERVSVGQGLYPAGVRMTSYVVDLEPGDDGPRTLVVDTVGLTRFDYARNTQVLDRMVETIEFSGG